MAKISIVLPTYNGEEYIRESIDSIISQTETDWELIVVDDCSTDRTLELVKEYVKVDTRIHLIHNETNKKLPEALNVGFREAKGEYLTWTSDDNVFLSEAFEVMSGYLERNHAVTMVCAGMVCMDEKKRILFEHPKYSLEKMYVNDVVGAAFMYRRSVLETVGEYNTELFCVEDYEYWVRILEAGLQIAYIPGCYYLYRYHEGSLTAEKQDIINAKRRELYYRHLPWFIDGLKDNPVNAMNIYNEILNGGFMRVKDIRRQFVSIVPQLSKDIDLPSDRDFIIYGADITGKRIYDILKTRVKMVCDQSEKKQGERMGDLTVVSAFEAVEYYNKSRNHHFIICVGWKYQIEVMDWLIENNIKEYSLYWNVL